MGLYEDGLILRWAYIWPDVYVSEKGWTKKGKLIAKPFQVKFFFKKIRR